MYTKVGKHKNKNQFSDVKMSKEGEKQGKKGERKRDELAVILLG